MAAAAAAGCRLLGADCITGRAAGGGSFLSTLMLSADGGAGWACGVLLARRALAVAVPRARAVVVRHAVDHAHAPPVELAPTVADLAAVPRAAHAVLLLIPQD
eukprot:4812827-Prymnesium_polylepis.1